jgi:glycosyltransferase involved in cell wall biosynthesis
MYKTGLSVIIPFVGEYPQVLFTIQSIAQSLLPYGCEFEIIAVNNYCQYVEDQSRVIIDKKIKLINQFYISGKGLNTEDFTEIVESMPALQDRSGPAVKACAGRNPWLKYIEYKDRLSHWQAKRVGVDAAQYDTLLFADAHVVPSFSLFDMFMCYRFKNDEDGFYFDNGTMHMPLTYKILEWRKLIYKMVIEGKDMHFWTYSFTPFRGNEKTPFEVPCMSTCGMMISRYIYDKIGPWPSGLGIYGGGENFMNYTLAVTGYKKYIYPGTVLHHHGDKRDYHYEYDDMVYNRMTAHYLFGGKRLLDLFTQHTKGRPSVLDDMNQNCYMEHKDHRERIKAIQKYEIKEWAEKWGYCCG